MKRPPNHYTNQAIKQLVPYIFLKGAILLYFAYFYRYSYQKKKKQKTITRSKKQTSKIWGKIGRLEKGKNGNTFPKKPIV